MNVKQKNALSQGRTAQVATLKTLRWWIENNIELVECVDCDFSEQRKPKTVEKSEHANQEMIGIFKPE